MRSPRHHRVVRRVWLIVALLAVLTSCSDDDGQSDRTAAELADDIGCTEVQRIEYLDSPMRFGAASEGVDCQLRDIELQVFVRAPAGDKDDPMYARSEGGSLENIDRTLRPNDDGCTRVVIGDGWFVVGNSDPVLRVVAKRLGGSVRPVEPITPPASYYPPGCNGG